MSVSNQTLTITGLITELGPWAFVTVTPNLDDRFEVAVNVTEVDVEQGCTYQINGGIAGTTVDIINPTGQTLANVVYRIIHTHTVERPLNEVAVAAIAGPGALVPNAESQYIVGSSQVFQLNDLAIANAPQNIPIDGAAAGNLHNTGLAEEPVAFDAVGDTMTFNRTGVYNIKYIGTIAHNAADTFTVELLNGNGIVFDHKDILAGTAAADAFEAMVVVEAIAVIAAIDGLDNVFHGAINSNNVGGGGVLTGADGKFIVTKIG